MPKNDDPRARAEEGVDRREAGKQRSVDEYYARQENLQPTPTQRENDLAKVGALDIDDKEDDGSEPDPHAFSYSDADDDPYEPREANYNTREDRPARSGGARKSGGGGAKKSGAKKAAGRKAASRKASQRQEGGESGGEGGQGGE